MALLGFLPDNFGPTDSFKPTSIELHQTWTFEGRSIDRVPWPPLDELIIRVLLEPTNSPFQLVQIQFSSLSKHLLFAGADLSMDLTPLGDFFFDSSLDFDSDKEKRKK